MIYISSAGENVLQLIIVLFIFAGVLFASYAVTKWIAGYQKSYSQNRNLEVVEMIKLSSDKSAQIVRAGENHYYVIALGKTEVTLLGEISGEELIERDNDASEQNEMTNLDFKSILSKFTNKK